MILISTNTLILIINIIIKIHELLLSHLENCIQMLILKLTKFEFVRAGEEFKNII